MISNLTIATQICDIDLRYMPTWLKNHNNDCPILIGCDSNAFYHSTQDNVVVFQNKLNNDFAQARNNILEKVQTKYVLFLDADELLSPTTDLAHIIGFLDNHPEYDGFAFLRLNIFGRQFIDYPNYHPCLLRSNIRYINNSPHRGASPGCHEMPVGNIGQVDNIIIHLKEEWTGNFRQKGYVDSNNEQAIANLERKIHGSNN